MATTVRLENGLRKLKMAPITGEGYGPIFTVADMTNLTAETTERKSFASLHRNI